MCQVEDAELCDVWRETERRSARERKCTECHRLIQKGERYLNVAGLYEGSWGTMSLCAHCRIGADWLRAECGGFLLDGVREEIHEHAQEYHSLALWRLVIGAMHKWQRFDGTGLMAIPKMPPLSSPTP